jgi:gentisate 1,2-dioxygenase
MQRQASSGPATPSPERDAFYAKLREHSLGPLWEVLRDLLPAQPSPRIATHKWGWEGLRAFALEAGALLTAEEAERRVLVLENPVLPGQSQATTTLYAGIQLVLPGEIAPAHRHTQSALRFTLESDGAYTSVAGERADLAFGDFLITPSWSVHDHGNDGKGPALWLDVLDVPIVGFVNAGFAQQHNSRAQALVRPAGDSVARYGSGLLPFDKATPYGATSPAFHYRYAEARSAVLAIAAAGLDPHWGASLRYANPLDGGWAMPTIACWLTHLPAGFATQPVRSTDALIVAVAEGRGAFRAGDQRIAFGPKDIFVIPNWTWRSFEAAEDCVMFVCSDRALQEKIDLWREEKAPSR